ncbi:MAG: hypothetical protein ACLR5G_05310 [Eubacteriales bacterium]
MVKKMRFWGTSAGEATPTPFCECRICQNAREKGGRELRLRSSFRIDEKTIIDVGADFAAEAQNMGESLYDIEVYSIRTRMRITSTTWFSGPARSRARSPTSR